MTLRSRLRCRLLSGAAGVVAGLSGFVFSGPVAHAAFTPGLEQFPGAAGCALSEPSSGGCAELPAPTAGQGLVRDGNDLYLSTGDDAGGPSALYHYRRIAGGVELRSCLVQTPSAQSASLGCGVVSLLPRFVTRPALADGAVYLGGAYGDLSSTLTGVIAVVHRDADSGELSPANASCRAANAVEAPACDSANYDRLGADVVELVVAPDGSTLHALARTGPETQLVTYARGTDATLTPTSCLSNFSAQCNWPFAEKRALLSNATQLVVAPDGVDAYLASPKGVVHLARIQATGQLVVDDCVGDGEDVAALCDKGPGDFRGVSSLSMIDDDQVIAVAYGDDSTSVVRLLRDGSGTLTEAGCIGTVEEDGCGIAAGVTAPRLATATPDGKNVIIAGSPGQPLVTLIAGGATGLRPIPLGTSGCAAVSGVTPPTGCAADVRGVVALNGAAAPAVDMIVQDDEVIVTTHGSFLFFVRGRAPGCLQRNVTVQRPWGSLPLSCGDPNGDQIAYAIGREPEHGVLGEISQNPSSVGYSPDDTYEGTDSFTYGAGDGTFTSAPATYTLILPSGPNTVKPEPEPVKGDNKGPGNDSGRGNDDKGATPADDDERKQRDAAGNPGGASGAAVPAGMIDLAATGKQLTVSSKRIVAFKVTCRGGPGAAACKGGLRLSAATRLLVDGKRQVVTFGRKDYVIPAGLTFTVSLRLPPKLAALITKKRPVAASLLAIGTVPGTATPVTASVTLKR